MDKHNVNTRHILTLFYMDYLFEDKYIGASDFVIKMIADDDSLIGDQIKKIRSGLKKDYNV